MTQTLTYSFSLEETEAGVVRVLHLKPLTEEAAEQLAKDASIAAILDMLGADAGALLDGIFGDLGLGAAYEKGGMGALIEALAGLAHENGFDDLPDSFGSSLLPEGDGNTDDPLGAYMGLPNFSTSLEDELADKEGQAMQSTGEGDSDGGSILDTFVQGFGELVGAAAEAVGDALSPCGDTEGGEHLKETGGAFWYNGLSEAEQGALCQLAEEYAAENDEDTEDSTETPDPAAGDGDTQMPEGPDSENGGITLEELMNDPDFLRRLLGDLNSEILTDPDQIQLDIDPALIEASLDALILVDPNDDAALYAGEMDPSLSDPTYGLVDPSGGEIDLF